MKRTYQDAAASWGPRSELYPAKSPGQGMRWRRGVPETCFKAHMTEEERIGRIEQKLPR